MKKTILLFAAAVLLSMASIFAQGGTTGPLTWEINDGTLTISGEGAMPGYSSVGPPWYNYRDNIHTLIIENGVTDISYYAFSYFSNLTSVSIANTVLSIEFYAFTQCTSLPSIVIPNGITKIDEGVFYGCTALSNFFIPKNVANINAKAFFACKNLTSLEVDIENYYYASENGVLFNKDKTVLSCYPAGKSGAYIIPNNVVTIGSGAFLFCKKLTSVTIPNSVTNIEVTAFYRCANLKKITNLNPIPVNISGNVFVELNLSEITLEVPMGSVAAYKEANVWKEFNIVGINVGITSPKSLQMSFYPNPTTGELRVESGKLRVENIEIFDIYGKKMSQVSNLTSHISNQINISHLPAGVYFVKVYTENGMFVEKVIKN